MGDNVHRKIFIFLVGIAIVGLGLGLYSLRGSEPQYPSEVPDFAYNNEKSLRAYRVALAIPEVLEKMPCYCGCVDMRHGDVVIQHDNLRECYVRDDGTFEEHASYCELCVVEALEVYEGYEQGLSLAEIRSGIEKKYEDLGKPTNTPPL